MWTVLAQKCRGVGPLCSMCVDQAPLYFRQDPNGTTAEVFHQPKPADAALVQQIAANCPGNAIGEVDQVSVPPPPSLPPLDP